MTGKFKYDHVASDLADLHWLTVNKRITFKIALIVFKTLSGLAPEYLKDLLKFTSAESQILIIEVKNLITNGITNRKSFLKYK